MRPPTSAPSPAEIAFELNRAVLAGDDGLLAGGGVSLPHGAGHTQVAGDYARIRSIAVLWS